MVPSGFFVMRTPLLPFQELLDWAAGVEAPEAPDDPDALERDRQLLRRRLRLLVKRRDIREAIFVSSPALEELIDAWAGDPESPRGKQCERALVRYFARMTGRPTPFGLFAGVSTGVVADETLLALEGHESYRRHTRLDAGYLVDVVDGLLADPPVRASATYRPNPSLYRVGDRYRYVRSRPGADEERHVLVSVRASAALETTLEATAGGATPRDVTTAIASATGAEPERARRFVDDLIERQVLAPELDLHITGADATYGLAASVPALATAREELASLDAKELGVPPDRYRRIAGILADLPAEQKLERLFQVDLTKASPRATLGRDVVDEIVRGIELLRRIAAPSGNDPLRPFVERFQARFEGGAVPLLDALDPDFGVSVDDEPAPSPLLAGLGAADGRSRPANWGRREDHLLARLLDARAGAAQELVLNSRDLEKLEQKDPLPLPDACAAMAVVAAPSERELAQGRFRVLLAGVDGPSGARLLGRFCHVDPGLRAAVEEHLRAEEALDPDAVFAEIVHLTRARDVNVIGRPRLRDHELVCLGGSGAPPDHQLSLDDLLVSVEDGRVVLRSRRLGRRVVPRLTSAHNFAYRGMAVYRFLCRLQQQGSSETPSFWGPLASSPFLPRVRAGRVVIERARWQLAASELGLRGDRDADFRAVHEWRRSRGVPRFVGLAEPGFELPVDLDNVLAVESLVQIVRSRDFARIVELFPSADELCAHGPEGAFRHELVVPFVRTRQPTAPSHRRPADGHVPRTFPPGGEWIYARIYTGETAADGVLTADLASLVRELTGSGLADRWFFLRYRDPEFHLRVRFHGDPARLHADARPTVEAAGAGLVDRGLAWRVELGTYEREVERYGGPEAIELAEQVFHADSEAVLAILPMLEPGDEGQEERWRLGLCGADRLLVDLGLDNRERLALVRSQRDGLVRRFGWDSGVLGRVGERFRRERPALERLLDSQAGEPGPLEPGLRILRERSRVVEPIGRELAMLSNAGDLTTPLSNVAGSLLHMHLNRLLRGDNAAQEAVICDFLVRLYEGRARRPGTPS
jgi:thiopeptide-type bacteriocin biosynthesis protein